MIKIHKKGNDWAVSIKDGHNPLGDDVEVIEIEDDELENFRASQEVEDPYDVKRTKAYPEIGDVIDALFKKEAGDSAEWDAIAEARQLIKAKYPKEN